MIKIENKIKRFSATAKLVCAITKTETEKILNEDYGFLKDSDEQLKKMMYCELTGERLVPKTIVDYTRSPFIYPAGNVRITIDSDIRGPAGFGQVNISDIFDRNMPTVSVFPDERCVLEVKYDEFIPEFIHKIIQVEDTATSGMSKYAVCRRFV
jgi:hypothetical protein